MPSVHIRDNLDLLPNQYRITLMGVTLAEAEIYPERDLAINPGQVFGAIDGLATKDPAFGLEAFWIDSNQKTAPRLWLHRGGRQHGGGHAPKPKLQRHAHELLGHEDVQQLVDMLAKSSPKLAEELVPGTVSLSQLLSILQSLLREHVPIRDLRSIAESLASGAGKSQEPAAMVAQARLALSRMIVQNIYGNRDELVVITQTHRWNSYC